MKTLLFLIISLFSLISCTTYTRINVYTESSNQDQDHEANQLKNTDEDDERRLSVNRKIVRVSR